MAVDQVRIRAAIPTVNEALRRVTAANQRLLQSSRQENLEFALNEWHGAIIVLAAACGVIAEASPLDLIPDATDFAKLVWEVQACLEHHHLADARRLAWPVT